MAPPGRRDGVSVSEPPPTVTSPVVDALLTARRGSSLAHLVREPFRFDFFQAVRLIALAASTTDSGEPASPQEFLVDGDPYEHHIRFRAHVGHAFPPTAISGFDVETSTDLEAGRTPHSEMTVAFLGLAGPGGVLPGHAVQLVLDRIRTKDFSLRDFWDLFNHRLIAQFYLAWEKCHFYVGYEKARRETARPEDAFTQSLYSLVGLGTSGLRGRQTVPDEVLLYYAGHFAHRPRSATALEQILADHFGVPTEIHQFQGQWMNLRPADQTRFTSDPLGRGNNQLGVATIAGRRVWGIENKFRVRLGVLSYAQFCAYMPSGDTHVALGELVRSFVGPAIDFDLQLVLDRHEVPPCQMMTEGGVRLGWNTWMFNGRATHEVDDAEFGCDGMPAQ